MTMIGYTANSRLGETLRIVPLMVRVYTWERLGIVTCVLKGSLQF
jgi:hypothetical protein